MEEQKLWLKALHGVQGSTKSVKIPADSINVCMVRVLCSSQTAANPKKVTFVTIFGGAKF